MTLIKAKISSPALL